MPRAFTAKINSSQLQIEEAFLSKDDAAEWRQMVLETLEHRELIAFDLQAYASGLAHSVRTCGGGYVRTAWLSGFSTSEQWAAGDPVTGYELMLKMKATIAGKP